MTKLIKGLGFFGLGFFLAIIFCFTIVFLHPGSASRHVNDQLIVLSAHKQSLVSSDSLITSILLTRLEQETRNGQPFNVGTELKKMLPDNNNAFVIETDLTFQEIFEKKRCELVNTYHENNPQHFDNYVSLLKTLAPQYCLDLKTEKNIIKALANFSLIQDMNFRRKLFFDSSLMHSLRAFAQQKPSIAKALANFYVVLASDALQSNYLKLSVFLLGISQEIYPNLPAQDRMLALIEEEGYYLQTIPTGGEVTFLGYQHSSWMSLIGLLVLLVFIGWIICLYIMNQKQANKMNVDYLMQKYDWSDEQPTVAMVINEIRYDVDDTNDAKVKDKDDDENFKTSDTDEVESNPKVISIHKDKPQK
ncbi:MAG: hypothetical protein LBE20_04800 [Deltaproteobacteria bacterium]|jgi:uncharacterized membrane-anchored protein YhcB (DUF1043 family)|nr:hypothetical protein [Deltaproteobacteria bacterium]